MIVASVRDVCNQQVRRLSFENNPLITIIVRPRCVVDVKLARVHVYCLIGPRCDIWRDGAVNCLVSGGIDVIAIGPRLPWSGRAIKKLQRSRVVCRASHPDLGEVGITIDCAPARVIPNIARNSWGINANGFARSGLIPTPHPLSEGTASEDCGVGRKVRLSRQDCFLAAKLASIIVPITPV